MEVKTVITDFSDQVNSDAHSLFQAWRRNNPDGFFLNRHTSKKYMLHHVDCEHLGENTWEPTDYAKSLTQKPKICCVSYEILEEWAVDHGGVVVDCRHCIAYDA